ncbi:MAG: AMP-binding protein [Actinomycetota bacterium]|nr:AMP-binding protein [Actinomycetota bacterium]
MPNPITTLRNFAVSVEAAGRSGMLGPYWPWQWARVPEVIWRRGLTLGAAYGFGAALRGNTTAAVDDAGSSTFVEMEAWTDALAVGLAEQGIKAGDTVAVLCRNHRRFVAGVVALGKLGVDIVYLNTGFAGPQLVDVAEREGAAALLVDEEFLELTEGLGEDVRLVVAWSEHGQGSKRAVSFDRLVSSGVGRGAPSPERRQGRQVVLTSGTTGTPKGANRKVGSAFEPFLSILSRIPLRTSDTTLIAAPMFHSWGLANVALALVLGTKIVLPRRFDPEDALRLIEEHSVTVLAAVPVMIQRIMALPDDVLRRYDTSSLRVVGLSGSALPGELATRFMDVFGDVIYNLYGSTEVGWVSIADPRDLREAPGTAGRVPIGTTVRILDDDGAEVPTGTTGRIFVRSGLLFENYTGGGGKDVIDGFMSIGDVGCFDDVGRLFVAGRDDDMIVSGGENVFPREVEDLLADHESVADVAIIGVSDHDFGQRLVAFVVPSDAATAIDDDELKDYVRSHLARHKVPRQIVTMDELPRNTTGKVLKRELAAHLDGGGRGDGGAGG